MPLDARATRVDEIVTTPGSGEDPTLKIPMCSFSE
jgi:hypothetical protein